MPYAVPLTRASASKCSQHVTHTFASCTRSQCKLEGFGCLLDLFRHLWCNGSKNQPSQEISHHDAANPTCGLLGPNWIACCCLLACLRACWRACLRAACLLACLRATCLLAACWLLLACCLLACCLLACLFAFLFPHETAEKDTTLLRTCTQCG